MRRRKNQHEILWLLGAKFIKNKHFTGRDFTFVLIQISVRHSKERMTTRKKEDFGKVLTCFFRTNPIPTSTLTPSPRKKK